MPTTLDILRGQSLAERLRSIWSAPVAPRPLTDLRYRRILVPGLTGGEVQFALLALLAEALRLRGADVTALCCDAVLPACSLRKADHVEPACTRWCHANLPALLDAAPLPHRWYGRLVPAPERQRLAAEARRVPPAAVPELSRGGLHLGSHVLRSIEGHFKVGRFDPEDPAMAAAAPRFVAAALVAHEAMVRAFGELRPDKLLLNDGQKIEWGIARAVAGQREIPVDVVRTGPRSGTICFERDVPGRPPRRMRGWDAWRDVPLDAAQERALDRYMRGRATRPYEGRDLCSWTRASTSADVRSACGLPAGRGAGLVFAMFPNLSYDSGTTSSAPVFPTPADWVTRTVEHFRAWPRHHLVIKTNPTEAIRAALDPLRETLRRRTGTLPPNVHLLPADTPITAHDLLRETDIALAYTSTVIIEAAWLGRPVVMVGGGRHKGTGIAIDVDDAHAYVGLLESMCAGSVPAPVDPQVARRYAYAVFFRDLVPLDHLELSGRHVARVVPESRGDLVPGASPALDAVCDAVLRDDAVDAAGLWPDPWPQPG